MGSDPFQKVEATTMSYPHEQLVAGSPPIPDALSSVPTSPVGGRPGVGARLVPEGASRKGPSATRGLNAWSPVAIPQQVPLLGRSYYRRTNTIPRGRQYYGFNSMAYKKEHNSWRKRSRKRSGIRSPFRSCKNDGLIGQSFFVKRGTQVHLFYI